MSEAPNSGNARPKKQARAEASKAAPELMLQPKNSSFPKAPVQLLQAAASSSSVPMIQLGNQGLNTVQFIQAASSNSVPMIQLGNQVATPPLAIVRPSQIIPTTPPGGPPITPNQYIPYTPPGTPPQYIPYYGIVAPTTPLDMPPTTRHGALQLPVPPPKTPPGIPPPQTPIIAAPMTPEIIYESRIHHKQGLKGPLLFYSCGP